MPEIKNNPNKTDKVEVTLKEYKDGKVIEEYTTEQFILVAEVKQGDKEGLAVVSHLNLPLARSMEIAMRTAAIAKHVLGSTMKDMMSLHEKEDKEEEKGGSRES